MKLKTNLHFHCSDDPRDGLSYSFYESIEEAKRLEFKALALTCHDAIINPPEYHTYAKERGILFIPGIERTVEGAHVVVLNPHQSIMEVNTFSDLALYRATHKESFIIAAHPYFFVSSMGGRRLKKHVALFDAIEHSWFYSKFFDLNILAKRVARKNNLPFIATSDTHDIAYLKTAYAVLDVEEPTIENVFKAIRSQSFTNFVQPARIFYELFKYVRYRIEKIRKQKAMRNIKKTPLSVPSPKLAPVPVKTEK